MHKHRFKLYTPYPGYIAMFHLRWTCECGQPLMIFKPDFKAFGFNSVW